MSDHLQTEEIESYRLRELTAGDLLRVDGHLEVCADCRQLAGEVRIDIELPPAAPPAHLGYEQLESYVDERLDDVEREIADVHLRVCESCRAELDDLIEMRAMIAEDLKKKIPAEGSFWEGLFSWRRLAAVAVTALIVSAGVIYLVQSERRPDVADGGTATPTPAIVASPEVALPPNSNTGIAGIAESNSNVASPDLSPFDNLPRMYREEVERAVATGRLETPRDLGQLRGQTGKLMGGGSESVPFALVGPVGKVIQTDRPQFRWRPLDGADSYIVGVYDGDFNRVAVSPKISATNWRPDRPLPRGRTYVWQVTAIKDGSEVKSPVRPAPDARFKVLDSGQASELARVASQFKNEHLLLGVLYAKAGLLADAEREFRRALAKDPNPKDARRFLTQVRKLQ